MDDTRIVKVTATWQTTHSIEVPADAPEITTLEQVLEYEDINADTAELMDWKIRDDDQGAP